MSSTIDTGAFVASADHATTTSGDFVAELTVEVGGFGLMPARVELEDDGAIIVYELFTGRFGIAATWNQAVQNLSVSLQSYLDFLRERGPERLSGRLAEHLVALSSRRYGAFRHTTVSGNNRRLALAA